MDLLLPSMPVQLRIKVANLSKVGSLRKYMGNENEGFFTSDKGVFNTLDGGKTWQKESDLKIEFFCAADKNTLYAIDFAGNVYKRVP